MGQSTAAQGSSDWWKSVPHFVYAVVVAAVDWLVMWAKVVAAPGTVRQSCAPMVCVFSWLLAQTVSGTIQQKVHRTVDSSATTSAVQAKPADLMVTVSAMSVAVVCVLMPQLATTTRRMVQKQMLTGECRGVLRSPGAQLPCSYPAGGQTTARCS